MSNNIKLFLKFFILMCILLSSNLAYSEDIFYLRVPIEENGERRKEVLDFYSNPDRPFQHSFLEPEIIFVPTHDGILDYLNGGEYIVICDVDDDRTAKAFEASKMKVPFVSHEANWVNAAEELGCDWSLLHPRWQDKKWPRRFIPGPPPIMTADNFKPKKSVDNKRLLLTICFDYFASFDRLVIDYDGTESETGHHYPSIEEIYQEAQVLAKCLKNNNIFPDKIVCAESKNYCPEKYTLVIREAIIRAFRKPGITSTAAIPTCLKEKVGHIGSRTCP